MPPDLTARIDDLPALRDPDLAAYRGKRVMITGGLGLIGSALARRLVALGAEVLLVDSMVPEAGGNLANIADIRDRVRVNIADIRDGERCGTCSPGRISCSTWRRRPATSTR